MVLHMINRLGLKWKVKKGIDVCSGTAALLRELFCFFLVWELMVIIGMGERAERSPGPAEPLPRARKSRGVPQRAGPGGLLGPGPPSAGLATAPSPPDSCPDLIIIHFYSFSIWIYFPPPEAGAEPIPARCG